MKTGVEMKASEFLGMKVLDKNGFEIGKITDMDIDPIKGSIDALNISKGDISFKSQNYLVSIDELGVIGDYVIINLGLDEVEAIEPVEEDSNTISIDIDD